MPTQTIAQKEDTSLFQTLFDQSPLSTQIFTPDGKTILVNKAWEKLWRVKWRDVKAYNVLKDRQLESLDIMSYIKRGFSGETLHIPATKYDPPKTFSVKGVASYRWVSAYIYPIKNNKGVIEYIVLQHRDVTASIQKREALQESEQLFKSIIENSATGFRLISEKGDIIYASPSTKTLLGYSVEEYKKLNIIDLVHPDDKSSYRKVLREVIAHPEKTVKLTYRIKHKDGSWRWMEGIGRNFLADPDIRAILSTFQDITERKHSEELIWQTNQTLNAIIQASPLAVYVLDNTGKVQLWSKKAEELFGWRAKEVIGKQLPIVQAQKVDEYSGLMKILLSGKSFTRETMRQRKDGTFFDVSISAAPILDGANQVIGIVAITADITERKSAERTLQYHASLLDSMSEAVIGTDMEARITSWNIGAEKLYGLSSTDVRGKIITDIIHNEPGLYQPETIAKELFRIGYWEGETEQRLDSGRFISVFSSVTLVKNAENEPIGIVAVTRDITKRKELERQKDDFMGIVSHELKTPVTSLKAYEQVLQSRFRKRGDDASVELLTKMDSQINKLTALIQDLLDVTKIEGGKLQFREEVFVFDELVDEIIEEVQRTTDRQKIRRVGKTEKSVLGDRERVGQVLTNFLTNAIKYSPNADTILVHLTRKKSAIVCTVKDFGVGISQDQLPHVFERFYRADEHKTVPGIGLGLYISREIIERQHGKIGVKSEVGKGSKFYFEFPLHSA